MPFLDNIGGTELIIIGIVLLVLFGGKKLTELARGIGESGRELKNVKKEMHDAFTGVEVEDKKTKKKKGGVSNV